MPESLPEAGGHSSPASKSLYTTLLVRLQANEDDAWRRLDHVYGPVVLGWCHGAGLRSDDAADVKQEVFRSVAEAIADFRRDKPGDSFRGWLWRITQNKLRDFFRRQRQQPAAAGGTTFRQQLQEIPLDGPADEESLPPGPSDEETGGVFRRALELVRSEFAENTWQAFWGVTVAGQSAAEVAAALGMSAGAVYVAKSRVLRRLREEFGPLLQ
jgi:RNA polymerase sigma-70 factor (ECF subfamily)